MADTRHVKGLDQLQKFLDTLPVKIEKNIMRGALRAGSKLILENARSRIHSVSGDLAQNLRISARIFKGRVVARIIAASRTFRNKGIWVEFGTQPHLISVRETDKPINAKASFRAGHIVRASMSTVNRALRLGSTGVYRDQVEHPGSRAQPFMRPALDATATAATVAAGEYVKKRLTKQGIDASDVEVSG